MAIAKQSDYPVLVFNFGPISFNLNAPSLSEMRDAVSLSLFGVELFRIAHRIDQVVGIDAGRSMVNIRVRQLSLFGFTLQWDHFGQYLGLNVALLPLLALALFSVYLIPAYPFLLAGVIQAYQLGVYPFVATMAAFSVFTESIIYAVSKVFKRWQEGIKSHVHCGLAPWLMPLTYLVCAALVVFSAYTSQAYEIYLASFVILALTRTFFEQSRLFLMHIPYARLCMHVFSYNIDDVPSARLELFSIRSAVPGKTFNESVNAAIIDSGVEHNLKLHTFKQRLRG